MTLNISKTNENVGHTTKSDKIIKRIIELNDAGFLVRGISIRMKAEGLHVSRETVKKILIINGFDL